MGIHSLSAGLPILLRSFCTIVLVCAAATAAALDSFADTVVDSAMLSFLQFGWQFAQLAGRLALSSCPGHAVASSLPVGAQIHLEVPM